MRKYDSLATAGRLTQDVLQSVSSVLECAMACGQSHARVQRLHLEHRHFTYTYRDDGGGHALRDSHTLCVLDGVRVTVANTAVIALLDWMRAQGLQFIFTGHVTRAAQVFSAPALQPAIYVVAVFVPDGGGGAGRAQLQWNTVYMHKCVDSSAVPAWSARCAAAIRAGASHFALCTLYRGSDYNEPSVDGVMPTHHELVCVAPRHHLTMARLDPARTWVLEDRFTTLVAWVLQQSYTWTLCMPSDDHAEWAYCTVLLDPLDSLY